jgi:DNA-binding transcriptional regulator YiaG
LRNVSLRGIEVRVCRNGHREIAIPRIEELHRVLAVAFANKPSKLAADEVRFLRRYLGYSQADFARTMGVAAETASRWESGTGMGATAERLLRLMVATQAPIADYSFDGLERRVGKGNAKPQRMTLRNVDSTWRTVAA